MELPREAMQSPTLGMLAPKIRGVAGSPTNPHATPSSHIGTVVAEENTGKPNVDLRSVSGSIRSPVSTVPSSGPHPHYSTYPEVVGYAYDPTPQARDAQHFSEHFPARSDFSAHSDPHHRFPPESNTFPTPLHQSQSQFQQQVPSHHAPSSPGAVVSENPAHAQTAPPGGGGGGGGGSDGASLQTKKMPNASTADARGDGHQKARRTTWILVGLLVLVTVLAAVIGSVVGSNAVNDAKAQCSAAALESNTDTDGPARGDCPPATVTVTVTAPGPPTQPYRVPTRGFVDLDCPTLTGMTQTVELRNRAFDFEMTCGSGFLRRAGTDILAIKMYSDYHCMQACAAYNLYSGRDLCVAFEFDSDLNVAFTEAGNCFLSNTTATIAPTASSDGRLKVVGILNSAEK